MAFLSRPGLSAVDDRGQEAAVSDLVYLVVGIAVLALFAGYAVLLRRA
jgi:hypothetical protein